MNDAQIKVMVDRFLSWKLPEGFSPDGGIRFVKPTPQYAAHWPVGTNLFSAAQAEAMIRHLLGDPVETEKSAHGLADAVVDGASIVIRIPFDSLENGSQIAWDRTGAGEHRVTDVRVYAAELADELNREKENGDTLITDMLDKAACRALDSGCEGVSP